MSESIHGHEVMRMMVEAGKPFTESELEETIVRTFGAQARFHTCSAENMTPKELIGFLKVRNKFVISDDAMAMRSENICDHE